MTPSLADGSPSIICVHGVRVTGAIWHPIRTRLPPDVQTMAPDLPGHGRRRDEGFRLETAVDVIADAIATTTASGRTIIAGHSLGGYVAMAVAARHPDRIDGLILTGCTTNPVGLWGRPYEAGVTLLSRVPSKWLDRWSRWHFRRQFSPEIAEPIVEGGFYARAMRPAVASVVGRDFLSMIQGFPGPVLVVNGRRDWPFRRHEAAFCQAAQPASLTLIERAGHLCLLEHPDAFTDAVRRFAHTLRPSSPGPAPSRSD